MRGQILKAVVMSSVLLAVTLPAQGQAAKVVKLVLRNPSGLTYPAWPITTGVPFPKDALASADHVELLDDRGRPVPIQTRAASTWGPKRSD